MSYFYKNKICNIKSCKTCNEEYVSKPKGDNYRITNKRAKLVLKHCQNNCKYCDRIMTKVNECSIWDEILKPKQQEDSRSIIKRNEYEMIKVKGDGNCFYRSILAANSIPEERHFELRQRTADILENLNFDEAAIEELNINSKDEYIYNAKKNGPYINSFEIYALANFLQINVIINMEDEKYANNPQITINGNNQDNENKIYLSYISGNNNEGHYNALIKQGNKSIKEKILNFIKLPTPTQLSEIKTLVWNCRGLSDFYKRQFLLDYMKANNIYIAAIQETHFKKEEEIYTKGFRIYRANNYSVKRKGVAFLIDNRLKAKIIKLEEDQNNGRYLKIKITSLITKESICLSTVYLEPTFNNPEAIPESIFESSIILGDMNEYPTLLQRYKVYHYSNFELNSVENPIKNMSDHEILIGNIKIPVCTVENKIQKIIVDRNIVNRNAEALFKISKGEQFQIDNPRRIVEVDADIEIVNYNMEEDYIEIKRNNDQKFKIYQEQKFKELESLITKGQLSKSEWIKVSEILSLKKTSKLYNKDENFQDIVNGFKELYSHKETETNIELTSISAILRQVNDYESVLNQVQVQNYCKSQARDYYGFSQSELIKITSIDSENRWVQFKKLEYIMIKMM